MDAFLFDGGNATQHSRYSLSNQDDNEDDLCEERSAGQWIAYKAVCANSSILSIVGSSVSTTWLDFFNIRVAHRHSKYQHSSQFHGWH